jgi:hypothetical protein
MSEGAAIFFVVCVVISLILFGWKRTTGVIIREGMRTGVRRWMK